MSISSIILYLYNKYPNTINYSLGAIIYFNTLLFISIFPIAVKRDDRKRPIIIENIWLFRFIKTILVVLSYFAISFFLPLAINNLFFVGSGVARLHNSIIVVAYINSFGNYGKIANTICSLICNMFPIIMAFCFIDLSASSDNKRYRRFNIAIVGTLSYVIYVLAYTGRDGIVYWALTFIIEYSLFKKYFNGNELLSRMKTLIMLIAISFISIFMYITIARFKEDGEGYGPIFWSIIDYMGQQVKNFSDRFSIDPPLSYGRKTFPIIIFIIEKIGIRIPYCPQEIIDNIYFQNGIYPWVFSTFIGSFLSDFGKVGTLILVATVSIYIGYLNMIKMRDKIFVSDLIILLLYIQAVSWGVFYFSLYSSNLYIIVAIILAIIIKYSINNKKVVVLYPKA